MRLQAAGAPRLAVSVKRGSIKAIIGYLDPTTSEKNGYFAQQMAFLTNPDASLTERLKFPRSTTKNCEIEQA